jgi:hypothetical protein
LEALYRQPQYRSQQQMNRIRAEESAADHLLCRPVYVSVLNACHAVVASIDVAQGEATTVRAPLQNSAQYNRCRLLH